MHMDVETALRIEAAERDYLRTRVQNLTRIAGNPYGAEVFSNAGQACFQVTASPSPMLNRIYGDSTHEPQAIVDLLARSVDCSAVTALIGPPSSLEHNVCMAGRQLQRLKGWTHLQLACAIEQTLVSDHPFDIEQITPQTFRAFAQIHADGFHTKAAQRLVNQASFEGLQADDSLKIYVIKEGAEVVAGAVMYLASNGVAYLGTAATGKQARGRGYHAALIAHRVGQAREHGCSLVAATALASSQSRRNLQRAGLKVSHAQGLYRLHDPE
ncbi:MAG TPA: GNAT family N-acetyltransferase [Pseudomonas sp.]|nr:GNAT family N-acetyltransferase [Pseudomonas sp.]